VECIRLKKHAIEIERPLQLLLLPRSLRLEGSVLMGVTGVIVVLGDSEAHIAGVERHMGDKAGGTVRSIGWLAEPRKVLPSQIS
jgi:hypothetical protein